MTSFPARLAMLTAVVAALGACAVPGVRTTPSPEAIAGEWTAVGTQAAQEVQAGRYAAADQLLADFQQRYPSSAEAPEARFYRALYRLDPANPAASIREGAALLDSVLAAPVTTPHRGDAAVLRRLAASLEAKPTVVTVAAPKEAAAPAPRVDTAARDEEIARLRDDLAKANAELERVRRRLATPKP